MDVFEIKSNNNYSIFQQLSKLQFDIEFIDLPYNNDYEMGFVVRNDISIIDIIKNIGFLRNKELNIFKSFSEIYVKNIDEKNKIYICITNDFYGFKASYEDIKYQFDNNDQLVQEKFVPGSFIENLLFIEKVYKFKFS